MSRWIDADELLKKQTTLTSCDEGGWDMEVRAVTVEDIEKAPTIAPESLRPSGRWEEIEWGMFFQCSCCGRVTDYHLTKFCPDCGARMEGEN